MLFDSPEESDCLPKRPLVACRPGVFAQSVDGEPEGVKLFFRVCRVARSVHRPVDAAVGFVEEFVEQVVPCGCGCCQVLLATRCPVGCRESPQDAAAKDCTPPGVGYQFARSGHAAEKSSSRVNHLPRPEREDIIAELFGELALELLFAVHVHLFAALRRASFSPISLMRVSLSG